MENEFINKLTEELAKNLHINKNIDFVEELFNNRIEELQDAIIQNNEYKKYMQKVHDVDKEILEKFENRWEIIRMIEKYTNASSKCEDLYEKLMYKYGFLDALLLITQGTKQINIEKFFKENKL